MQQNEILADQDYKCRLCHTRFSKNVHPQFDHIDGDHSNNSVENGQAICSNCHDAKSRKESQKRSIKEKDINFLRCCPFCGTELKGKHYTDDTTGEVLTTDYLSANDFTPCRKCKSVFKIIRKDPKAGTKNLRGKKVDGVVKHCAHCGIEYTNTEFLKANDYIKCEKCHAEFGVWIKEYKERGFW